MAQDIALRCACGAMEAVVAGAAPSRVNHVVCYCKDCQAFARYLRQDARILDEAGGTRIVQLEPSRVQIVKGAEHLACLRLTPKGLHRWYAACCDTPLANTLGTPKLAFAGLIAANLQAAPERFGPVIAHVHTGSALKPVEGFGFIHVGLRILRLVAQARVSGRWRKTPFFDAGTGQPVVQPTLAERSTQKR